MVIQWWNLLCIFNVELWYLLTRTQMRSEQWGHQRSTYHYSLILVRKEMIDQSLLAKKIFNVDIWYLLNWKTTRSEQRGDVWILNTANFSFDISVLAWPWEDLQCRYPISSQLNTDAKRTEISDILITLQLVFLSLCAQGKNGLHLPTQERLKDNDPWTKKKWGVQRWCNMRSEQRGPQWDRNNVPGSRFEQNIRNTLKRSYLWDLIIHNFAWRQLATNRIRPLAIVLNVRICQICLQSLIMMRFALVDAVAFCLTLWYDDCQWAVHSLLRDGISIFIARYSLIAYIILTQEIPSISPDNIKPWWALNLHLECLDSLQRLLPHSWSLSKLPLVPMTNKTRSMVFAAWPPSRLPTRR